jgi:hypothetical protein
MVKNSDVFGDVTRLSNKKTDLISLAVSKDLLRLCKKYHIMKRTNSTEQFTEYQFTKDIQKADVLTIMYDLIRCLAQEVQPDVDVGSQEEFKKKVNPNDHYSLSKFLVSKFKEDGNVVSILKTLHQTIIARVLHRFRDTFRSGYPEIGFRDSRGSWHVFIYITKDPNTGKIQSVTSAHRRTEQVYTPSPNSFDYLNCFKFKWELQMHFDINTFTVNKVTLSLLDIIYDEKKLKKKFQREEKIVRQTFINCENNIEGVESPNSKKFRCTIL